MDFNTLKASYDSVKKLIIKTHKELKGIDAELKSLSDEISVDEANYQKCYAEAKSKSEDAYRRKLTAPIEEQLLKAEERLNSLNEEYATELAETTEEKYMESCTNEQDILKEVKESTDILKEKLQVTLGNNFYEALMKYFDGITISLNHDSLDKLIMYFNQCSAEIEKMNAHPDRVDSAISTLEKALLSMQSSKLEQNKNAVFILLIVILTLTILAYKYIFPVYAVFLTLLATYNVIKSYKIYKIFAVQKAAVDNLKAIEDLLHEQIVDEVKKKTEEINAFYTAEIKKTEATIEKLKSDLQHATITADNSFVFDDSSLKMDYEANNRRRDVKEATLLQNKRELNAKLEELFSKEAEYKEQLDSIVGDIQNRYLDFNKVGTNFIFEPRFLFDIDTAKSKPQFFEHPQQSALFLYQDISDVNNFIRLINVQLRNKLSPFSLTVLVYDQANLGQAFLLFLPKTNRADDSASRLFRIISKEDDLKEELSKVSLELIKRNSDINREFDGIESYNRKMVELESLTLPYEFIFLIDPSSEFLKLEECKQLLRNGGSLGIFTHVFINYSKFRNLGDDAFELLECIGKTYLLENGNFAERAKQFISDSFLSK